MRGNGIAKYRNEAQKYHGLILIYMNLQRLCFSKLENIQALACK